MPLVRRNLGIAEHEVELFGGVVVVVARQREPRQIELSEAPERSVRGRKRSQRRRALLLFARNVDPEQGSAQAGGVAQERVDRRIAGDRVEGGGRARRVALRLGAGRGHLRERAIAARRFGGDLVETGFRLVELAALERRERLLELVSGRLLGPFALILPIAKAGRGEHDQRRAGEDEVLVFLPEFRRLVAPDFLVNFVKDIAHAWRSNRRSRAPSGAAGVWRISAGLSQGDGESERGPR